MTVFGGVVFIDDYPAAVGFPPRASVYSHRFALCRSVINNWAGHCQRLYETGVGHCLTHRAMPFLNVSVSLIVVSWI
jgi:hypothetical protein